MIADTFNRVHNYLRISLTDKCNLRCFYCMPEEEYSFMPSNQLMQADEIEGQQRFFVKEAKIRLTKKEPRKDFADIVKKIIYLNVNFTLIINATSCISIAIMIKDQNRKS